MQYTAKTQQLFFTDLLYCRYCSQIIIASPPPQLSADIALLHLGEPLELGGAVSPVCLAPPGSYDNQVSVVTGWGVTSPLGGGECIPG